VRPGRGKRADGPSNVLARRLSMRSGNPSRRRVQPATIASWSSEPHRRGLPTRLDINEAMDGVGIILDELTPPAYLATSV